MFRGPQQKTVELYVPSFFDMLIPRQKCQFLTKQCSELE